MSREMDLWVRDAQVQQQRYDDERRKTDVELEPLMIKLQVVRVVCVSVCAACVLAALLHYFLNVLSDCARGHGRTPAAGCFSARCMRSE